MANVRISKSIFVRDHRRRFRVMIAMRLFETASQHKLAGIFAHLDTHTDWDLQLLRTQEELTPETLDEAVGNGLDGIIVSIRHDSRIFGKLAALDCPLVVMDCDPPELRQRKKNLAIIRNDSADIARAAMRAFANAGNFKTFAFANSRYPSDWSALREKAFLEETKGRAVVLKPTGRENDAGQIVDFLRSLAQPAALLAAHDTRAADVIAAAREAGICVPHPLSVLGVDNDPYVCNRTAPPIASLEPDFFAEGNAAATLLDKLMRARTPGATRHVTFGVKRTVLRGSLTNLPPAQGVIARAKEFVRENAIRRITPQDVASHLRISRQLLDLRFHEAGEESVGRLITRTKLAEAKRLLKETDTPISLVASQCGFGNANALKNLFKRSFGLTMRDWRNQSAELSGKRHPCK